MLRYVETFFRHRILLTAPLVIALTISFALTSMQPRTYETGGNMWFDNQSSAAQDAAAPTTSTLSPAEQEVEVLKELLLTRDFSAKVGARGPLKDYIAANPNVSTSVFTRILHKVGIGSGTPAAIDDQVFDAVSNDVSVVATGPQVVNITMTYPSASVAAGTVQAIMDQFSSELLTTRHDAAQASVDYYQVRLQDAQQAAAEADDTLNRYVAGLARAASAKGSSSSAGVITTDPQFAALTRSDDLAHQRYDSLVASYDQANLDLLHVADHSGFRVIDKPAVPASPLGFTKKLLSASFAGLFIGLVVVVLGLVLLTIVDTTARSAADVERHLGLTVGGHVRDFTPREEPRTTKGMRGLRQWLLPQSR